MAGTMVEFRAMRDEFGHLPAGDVRRCLLALSGELIVALRRLSNIALIEQRAQRSKLR